VRAGLIFRLWKYIVIKWNTLTPSWLLADIIYVVLIPPLTISIGLSHICWLTRRAWHNSFSLVCLIVWNTFYILQSVSFKNDKQISWSKQWYLKNLTLETRWYDESTQFLVFAFEMICILIITKSPSCKKWTIRYMSTIHSDAQEFHGQVFSTAHVYRHPSPFNCLSYFFYFFCYFMSCFHPVRLPPLLRPRPSTYVMFVDLF